MSLNEYEMLSYEQYEASVKRAIERWGFSLDDFDFEDEGTPGLSSLDDLYLQSFTLHRPIYDTAGYIIDTYLLDQLEAEPPTVLETCLPLLSDGCFFFLGVIGAYMSLAYQPENLLHLQTIPYPSWWLLIILFGIGTTSSSLYRLYGRYWLRQEA